MILDGEAVVLDEQGRSDFGALQQALGGRGGKRSADEAIFFAFDVIYLDGYDLRRMAFSERRQMLECIIPADSSGAVRLSEAIEADGDELFASRARGLIAKKLDAPYRSGRLSDWLKIKCIQSDSFFIIGYEPSAAGLRYWQIIARRLSWQRSRLCWRRWYRFQRTRDNRPPAGSQQDQDGETACGA